MNKQELLEAIKAGDGWRVIGEMSEESKKILDKEIILKAIKASTGNEWRVIYTMSEESKKKILDE